MRKICVMLVLLGLVVCGAWGAEASKFRWTRIADGFWQNGNSWQYEDKTDNQWKNADDWPCTSTTDDANDSVFINTNEGEAVSYTIKLTEDVKLEALNIDTKNGTSVTIDLNGHNLIANTMALGHVGDDGASGSATSALTFIITDSSSSATKGSFSTGTVHLTSSSTNSVIRITNDVSVNITSTLDNTSSSQSGRLSVTGDGTGSFNTPGGTSEAFVTVNSNLVNHNGHTVPTPIATDTYYWTGNAGDSEWTTSGNWAPNADGSGHVPNGDYPGHADNETAVFGENVSEIKDFQIGSESENWTIYLQNNAESTDYKGVRITSITHNNEQIVINENSKGAFWFNCANDSKVGSIHVKNGGVRFQTGSLIIEGDLQIETGVDVVSWNTFFIDGKFINNGIISFLGGNTYKLSGNCENSGKINLGNFSLELNGGYSGTGELSLASGTINFAGTTNTVKKLTVSGTGKINNNSSEAVKLANVTLPDETNNVIFKGDFTIEEVGDEKFHAASAGTYFIDGDVDFSGCKEFEHNGSDGHGATIFFYNTTSTNTTSTAHTFKTKEGMKLYHFYFGGNVNIDLNGEVTVADECKMKITKSEYMPSSSYTATFTGSGSLKGNRGDESVDICASSSGIDEKFVVDANVTCAGNFYQRAGTKVVVNAGKTLDVKNDYRGCGGSSDPANELTVNGTISVGNDFGAGSAPFDTGANDAKVTIATGGELTVGNDIKYAKLFTNYGTVSVTKSITGVLTLENRAGTITVNESISGMTELNNWQTALLSVANTISATDIFNGGTIKTANLTSSGKINSTSLLVFTGTDGKLSLNPAETNIITNIEIDSEKKVKLDNNITISGNVKNNGTFDVDEKTVTFKGGSEKSEITGNTIDFVDVVINKDVDFKNSNNFINLTCEPESAATSEISINLETSEKQIVSNKLTLNGSEGAKVKLAGSGKFVTAGSDSEHFIGQYLLIGKDVEISDNDTTVKAGAFLAKKSEADGTNYSVINPHGWKFEGIIYKWTGTDSTEPTNFHLPANWEIGVVPDSSGIVTYAESVTNQPVLTKAVTIGHITIPAGCSLDLNGNNFEVTGICDELPEGSTFDISNAFVNSGTVILKGTETVSLPAGKVDEQGTWHYKGGGSGTVKEIENLAYKNLIISGTIGVATDYTVVAGDGISFGTDSETAKITGSAHFGSPVTLANDAIIGTSGASIIFDKSINGEKSLSLAGGNIEFEEDVGSETPLSSINVTDDSTITRTAASLINLNANISIESGKSLTCGHDIKISGNVANDGTIDASGKKLEIKGTGESNQIEISGNGTIIVAPADFTADYLSIGADLVIKEGTDVKTGSHKAYSGMVNTSLPAATSDPEKMAYAALFKNGWDLGYEFEFIWQGTTDNSWGEKSNWDVGIVPGAVSENTVGVAVVIPDSITVSNYPKLDGPASAYEIATLSVGTENASPHNAVLTLSSVVLKVSSSLTNYGIISYAGNARITNGTTPINDVLNGGTVEYSGTTSQTVTKFSSTTQDDYVNLKITGTDVKIDDKISVAKNLNIMQNDFSSSQFGSLLVNNALTLKGDLFVATACSLKSNSAGSIIFAGSSEQTIDVAAEPANAQFANLEISSGSSITTASNFTITGNLTNNNETGGFNASAGTVTFSGADSTVSGKNVFYDVRSTGAKITFSASNTFNNAAFTGASSTVTFAASNTFDTASFIGAGSTATFADENTFASLKFNGAGITAKFAANKEQTITDSFSSIGTATGKVHLTTAASSLVIDDNQSGTWWILNFPSEKGKALTAPDFVYTDISYSKSKYDIVHAWAPTIDEGAEDSTLNWFSRNYYWIGGSGTDGSKWEASANWKHRNDAGNLYPVRKWPTYDKKRNSIFIETASGNKDLILENAVTMKNLAVKDGAAIDLKGFTVSADDSDNATKDFVNKGTVRLYGASGQIDSSVENGSGSTVEYYAEAAGTTSAFVWGNVYENLNILGPFAMDSDISAVNLKFGKNEFYGASADSVRKFTVTGSASILNGSGNALYLKGENVFANPLAIGDSSVSPALSGGNIILNSDGNLRLASVVCDSLEVQSSVKFTQDVSSPVKFSGAYSTVDGNNVAFAENATFTGSAINLLGHNTFAKAASFCEDITLSGSNTFADFICKTPGSTLTFTPNTTQTVSQLTIHGSDASKINLTGSGEWMISPAAGGLNHSIAHAVITNSNFTDSANPVIVYAKNGYNTDGTGNTNWIFAGHEYVWTALDSAYPHEWNRSENWSPKSVPGRYADVKINQLAGGNYPVLSGDLYLDKGSKDFALDDDGDGSPDRNESLASCLTIASGAVFDFNGFQLTLNTLVNKGRIRLVGTEVITSDGAIGIAQLPLDSNSFLTGLFEYYGDFGLRVSPNFGDKFSLLEFTDGSSGQISGAISVSGETLISNGAGKSLELTGDNTFAGDVQISGAGNVTLKGQKSDTSPLSLTGAVDSSKLTIKSDVVLNGNVTTADTQDYEGKVTLNAGIVFNAADSRLSFGSDILSGNENSALTFESPASLGGNVTTALSQTYKKNLTLLADVIFTAGAGVKFDSASELSITSDKSAKFKSPLSANCDLAITVPLFDFDSNASFKHTDSTKALTLKSGTALTFKNVAFDAGKLIIDEGASFTQTGVNLATAVQKVSAIENNGSCVWDSGSEGGSLLLAGSISGSKADQIIFNKKNVSLSATPITISGVFFDLTVPGGINATNGSGLVVRRNFTVYGSYLHNSQSLTLGSVTFDDGRKYASANNDDGSAGLISSPSNLGSVKIVQEGSGKKFTSNIEGLSFSLDDASVAAGSIEFAEKLKALSLTNAENTNFAILFDSACEITEAVTFGTSGNVILGTKEDSACVFANTLEHTAGDTKLAGSILSSSAKFARTLLTQNVKIDCGSNSVIFTGDLDSDSSDSPRALSIGNETSLTSVKFEKTCGLVNPLASLLVYGNAEFGGNLISEEIVNLKGNVISFADVSLLSKKKYILLDGQNSRTVGTASGSLTFASDLFVDMDTEASLTLSSDITWQKIFCGYSGKITSGAVKLSGKDLILFGPTYSPDDPRYSGSDSRFAYFGYDSLAYKPASASLGFKSEFLTSGSQVILSGNFYANGLDLSGASFVIPNQAASNPIFNSSSDVTERQWGLPYAVAFNSEISNCSASSPEGSAFVTAAKAQNVTDKSGNTGFQFELPQISGAHSVSDSVICLTFDMALENSKGEVSSTIALVSSLEKGGIFYNGKSLAFDGKFYTESDGTDCSLPLSESSLALTDIPAFTPLYLKVSSAANNWNTDATASSAGSEDSTDRSGIHRNRTTDLSLFEGLFFAADGKTMCRNYGIGQWSENYADYSDAPIFATVDRARPVLVDLFTGQELHSTNTGTADSQKFYDSHNFIELRYSEPVDIGNLMAGAVEQNQNQQAQTEFNSAEKHGGAITNNSGSGGLTLAGFVSIEKGELTSGYKSGSAGSYSFNSDTNKAHALYRKFSKNAGDEEQIFPSRVRISVAGYVDEENPLSLDGAEFHNWIGYIDSSTSPAGQVIPLANKFITDLAVDSEGQPVKNIFDENNSSRSLSVNDRASSSPSSLYGDWDCSHPVFAAYVTNFNDSDPNVSWNYGDSDYRQYEMLGTVNSNTNAYIDTIEMHLFDNTQNYSADDLYKWAARKGWSSSGSNVIPGFEAPESAGGSRAIPQSAAMTHGGIRRSSLDGAISAFRYKYSLDDFESDFRPFAERDISQHVKSPIFRGETLSETFTDNDQPYLGLTINTNDSKLPIRTTFTVTYEPKKSFITDLAGNRLLHTDSGSDKKILHTIDITPPSFTMTISPVGENKIYAVFTKPLAYKGTYLSELGGELPSVLEKIASNLEFVYSEEDNVDTTSAPDGDKAISILSAELAVGNMDYTAILFTLDRKISLDDVEKIWIRINDLGEGTATLFGDVTASYIQDKLGNPVPVHTCHALSDFAINAVNMLYAYSDNTDDDGWDEHEIYGQGLAPESSDYAVHDFSEDGENYNRLRSGRDIVFQFEFFDSEDDKGKSALKNGEALALVYDEKANIRPEWKGSKYNLLTEGDWRIWLDNHFEAFSLSYNPSPLSASLPSPPLFADVEGSDILKNMTWRNEDFNIEAGKEYQFFFKILDSSGNVIQINHDGDTRTPRIPLYTFRMPKERISAGDFSYLDLWSFTTRDLTRQRGGVTILNNVINAALGEKTAIEVNMKNDGNLNVFVMTLDGNIIKRLSKGSVKSGTHYFYWDGKNGAGKPVARGLYFIRVSGSGIDETRKVMVVK
ncbi:FlgD immunoglobulin-like domain containing protein [Treponema ruminis]|uniref:FlgD/Vpr Ig-like domain-containing protein n=1 Tax=Treponema ruminis TaxID=744515 RepID=A0A7W8G9X3_9SPIR|nr:FlgD immunoglobulin-like domain containing protein [Treponema ruminis]MBB5226500.1 hypothetical protein [Treponema ruminis]